MFDVETTLSNWIRCRHTSRGCDWQIIFQPDEARDAEWQRDVHESRCLHAYFPDPTR